MNLFIEFSETAYIKIQLLLWTNTSETEMTLLSKLGRHH